jgi:hypothetical protein
VTLDSSFTLRAERTIAASRAQATLANHKDPTGGPVDGGIWLAGRRTAAGLDADDAIEVEMPTAFLAILMGKPVRKTIAPRAGMVLLD